MNDFCPNWVAKVKCGAGVSGRDCEFCAVAGALRDSLPLLIKLGDFIGNKENRCEIILAVRNALAILEGK